MPLTIIEGPRGSGKTLFIILYNIDSEGQIYSNFSLYGLPFSSRYNELDLITYLHLPKNVYVFLDEGYTWLESRLSSRYTNLFLTYKLYQLRKTTRQIYVTIQHRHTIDKRFREEWDFFVRCRRKDNGHPDWRKWDFRYTILNDRMKKIDVIDIDYKDSIPYFEFYNTYEIVEPSTQKRMEFEILKGSPKLLFKELERIAKEIYSDIDKEVTHNGIKYGLLKNGYPLAWEKYIYIYIHQVKKNVSQY